jgi:hypothetical protein
MKNSYLVKIFLLQFILFIVPVFSEISDLNKNNSREFTILLLGQTRSGKSCFVNSILGKNLAKIGSEDGEPTTEKMSNFTAKLENNILLNLIDTKGLENSPSDLFTLYEVINSTANKINIDSIFYLYSLTSEANTLKSDLEKIKFIFGGLKNLNIIFTKGTKVIKRKYIQHTLNEFNDNIPFPDIYINSFCNDKLDSSIMRKIINKLDKLSSVGEKLKIQLKKHYQKLSSKINEFKNTKYTDLSDILNSIYSDSKKVEDTKIEEMANIAMIGSIFIFIIMLPISIYLVRKYLPQNFFKKVTLSQQVNNNENKESDNQKSKYQTFIESVDKFSFLGKDLKNDNEINDNNNQTPSEPFSNNLQNKISNNENEKAEEIDANSKKPVQNQEHNFIENHNN